jgi:Dual specificity phosphatase, catalytic domain/PAP2 superfamily
MHERFLSPRAKIRMRATRDRIISGNNRQKNADASLTTCRTSRPTFRRAFGLSVGLSILFLVVYGGCNWVTSQRDSVATFYFHWERAIPFVPFFILPYMSIDLFFLGAPFVCQSERELRAFSRRVAAAILISGICFLLFPFRFAFPRPQADGGIGALFDWFRQLDAPYNLVPSLHATFWIFLAQLYFRHSRGLVRGAVVVWMFLILLSPVLAYQHHVIDIITGFALAGYCFYFFRESGEKLPVTGDYRIGFYYLTGGGIGFAVALMTWPWGALLVWPATALAIVAAAYFGAGPVIFRKADGKLPLSTWFVLGPCLAGQYLSLLYYRRQCCPSDEIVPNVWIGRTLNNREARAAVAAGVVAVLDLSAEFSEARAFRAVAYKNVPVLDLTGPTVQQLGEMAAFINEQSKHGVVYVHCKIGYSRSAAAVAAYLLLSRQADDVQQAFAMIRAARPSIVIRPEVIASLSDFKKFCLKASSPAERYLSSLAKAASY